jgi:hypothetical protein
MNISLKKKKRLCWVDGAITFNTSGAYSLTYNIPRNIREIRDIVIDNVPRFEKVQLIIGGMFFAETNRETFSQAFSRKWDIFWGKQSTRQSLFVDLFHQEIPFALFPSQANYQDHKVIFTFKNDEQRKQFFSDHSSLSYARPLRFSLPCLVHSFQIPFLQKTVFRNQHFYKGIWRRTMMIKLPKKDSSFRKWFGFHYIEKGPRKALSEKMDDQGNIVYFIDPLPLDETAQTFISVNDRYIIPYFEIWDLNFMVFRQGLCGPKWCR